MKRFGSRSPKGGEGRASGRERKEKEVPTVPSPLWSPAVDWDKEGTGSEGSKTHGTGGERVEKFVKCGREEEQFF